MINAGARKRVVIIGGGISGLTTAWKLSRAVGGNSLDIKVLESSNRTGGWIKSTNLPGVTTFESGPRSLRPVGVPGLATLKLVNELGLTDQILPVDQDAPASQNRYIYFNGALHQLPTGLAGMLTSQSPVLRGLIPALLREPFVRSRISPQDDESVHDFVSRRFSPKLAINLFSAMVHGIYAGDSSQLSVRGTLKVLYELERDHGSVVRGILAKSQEPFSKELIETLAQLKEANPKLAVVFKKASMYSFEGGMEELSKKLHRELSALPNVEIFVDQPVEKLQFQNSTVKVHTSPRSEPIEADHVISAIPSSNLQNLIDTPIPELTFNSSVDVAVVSLAFAKKVLPHEAFGYLVPRSVPDSKALGVVFDSCSFPSASPGHETLTVMMGGHQFQSKLGDPDKLTEDDLLTAARQVLKDQMGIKDEPAAHHTVLQRKCIPQYLVRHPQRMHSLHKLIQSQFPNLSVVGASYTGVAINDCVLHAEKLVNRLTSTGPLGDHSSAKHITGLELYETLD